MQFVKKMIPKPKFVYKDQPIVGNLSKAWYLMEEYGVLKGVSDPWPLPNGDVRLYLKSEIIENWNVKRENAG